MNPLLRVLFGLADAQVPAAPHPRAAEAQRLYAAYMDECAGHAQSIAVSSLQSGRAILDAPPDTQAAVLITAFQKGADGPRDATWMGRYFGSRAIIPLLLKKPLPLTDADFIAIFAGSGSPLSVITSRIGIIRAIENHAEARGLSPALRTALERFHTWLRSTSSGKRERDLAQRIFILLGGTVEKKTCPITDHDAWSARALARLNHIDEPRRAAWLALLEHAATATGSKPTQRWLNQSTPLMDGVGAEEATDLICTWLSLLGTPGPRPAPNQARDNTVPHPDNADVLKGLIWAASLLDQARMLDPVSTAAEVCFKKIPNIGPRSAKLGNACLWYLSTREGDRAIAELVRIRAKIRHPSIRKQIDKAIARQAAARGQTPEDAMDLAVPTFDLVLPGVLRRAIGAFEATLTITGSASTETTWKSQTGRITRSTPKAARETDADAVKAFSRVERDIERTLPGQRDRIERFYLAGRSWSLEDWKKRFAEHPLLHNLTSRLIWLLGGPPSRDGSASSASTTPALPALWHESRFINSAGESIDPPADTRISLWHPILSTAEEVAAWRDRLAALNIQQPFKQAHREIYIITDAERATEVYSNRFAAHILRQHQMAELCRSRAWSYRLAGMHFDNGGIVPTLAIPAADLSAEFCVEPIADPSDQHGSGISLHVTTDQVCFFRTGARDRLPLRDIPPIIFSEVLRDVDLFVGVCSVGNDPDWQDGGPGGLHLNYWRDFSWGALVESGKTRRDAIARLLPRLAIAPVCSLDDKFLIVRGRLRTYKIHLGSGNILMEPNDQYLCIVPARHPNAAFSDIRLPFEGDRVLSIILSKAFMLAADDRITDPSITRQIGAPNRPSPA